MMKVTLIDYTGKDSTNPTHAIDVLIFTKSTRLTMSPGLFDEVKAWPMKKKMEELAYMARTVPSSWEFVHYTFLIENVTRAFTHQLVRTRTASYAQQAMRVVDMQGWTYDMGPSFDKYRDQRDGSVLPDTPASWYQKGMAEIAQTYKELVASGVKTEDARGILPTNIHTNIVTCMNLRCFTDTVRKRSGMRTQSEYRAVLQAMVDEVLRVHPWAVVFLERSIDKLIKELEDKIMEHCRAAGMSDEEMWPTFKIVDEIKRSI